MKIKTILSILLFLFVLFTLTSCKSGDYKKAKEFIDDGKYDDAIILLEKLNDYEDSKELLLKAKYLNLLVYIDQNGEVKDDGNKYISTTDQDGIVYSIGKISTKKLAFKIENNSTGTGFYVNYNFDIIVEKDNPRSSFEASFNTAFGNAVAKESCSGSVNISKDFSEELKIDTYSSYIKDINGVEKRHFDFTKSIIPLENNYENLLINISNLLKTTNIDITIQNLGFK